MAEYNYYNRNTGKYPEIYYSTSTLLPLLALFVNLHLTPKSINHPSHSTSYSYNP